MAFAPHVAPFLGFRVHRPTSCWVCEGGRSMNESRKWYFDFERFDAYRHALRAAELVASRRRKLVGLPGKAGEQLERATAGAVTNIGAGSSAQGAERERVA